MKDLLFSDWRQWRVCFVAGLKKCLSGFLKILYCIVLGIASVLVYVGKQIEAFCKRELWASLIIGTLLVLMCVGWILTFARERAARVGAEMQRDSISYELMKFTQFYEGKKFFLTNDSNLYIITNDTTTVYDEDD